MRGNGFLGIDVGGTSIRVARAASDGSLTPCARHSTPPDGREGVALLRRLLCEFGPARGTAVVVAGGVRPGDGEITQSPNLPGWEGLRLRDELACRVLNDANGAVIGEAWRGALLGRRSAVLLTLGTGVGGGILLEGRLWEGNTGSAGEVGHVPVEPDGPPCACGGRGCLELYASGTAIALAARTPDAESAARAARAGDPGARAAFERAGRALGIVLAGLANVLNPEAFCLAGGVAPAFDLLESPIRREIAGRAFRLAQEGLALLPGALGEEAGLYGAVRAAGAGAAGEA
jgi:glucokinase